MAANNGLAPERQLKNSVTKNDLDNSGVMHVHLNTPFEYTTLPPQLPVDYDNSVWYNGRLRSRQQVLLSTPYHSAMWATALSIAIKKKAALAWEVEGAVRLRYQRAQQWLLNAGAGVGIFGWVPFLTAGLGSYFGVGYQFIEIERMAKGASSRVVNVHHLNPLQCNLTGNPNEPVEYTSDDGEIRPLRWHDVIIISDQLSPTADGRVMSASERSYKRIIADEALEKYIHEELTGRNPKAVHLIGGGVTNLQLNDSIEGSKAKADAMGNKMYMGHMFVDVMGDVPLHVATVPLVGLPDKTDVIRERERSDLIYAHNLDVDPQDINPSLVGRQGLGSTGNQSQVLSNKAKGLRSWEQQFTHQLNELALDDKTVFAFSERDLDDENKQQNLRKTAVDAEGVMIDKLIISADEARNNLVDAGYLPQEFLVTDITEGGQVGDDEKVITPDETNDDRDSSEASEEPEETNEEKAYRIAMEIWEAD